MLLRGLHAAEENFGARMKKVQASKLWKNTRLRCDCGGYPFPHRRGGGACYHSPREAYYQALRNGLPGNEAEELLWAVQLEKLPRK